MFVDYVSEMISFYECFAYPDMSLHENDRFFFFSSISCDVFEICNYNWTNGRKRGADSMTTT